MNTVEDLAEMRASEAEPSSLFRSWWERYFYQQQARFTQSLWQRGAKDYMAFNYKRTQRHVLILGLDNSRSVRVKAKGYLITSGEFTVFVHRKLRYNSRDELVVSSQRWNAVDPLSGCFITKDADSRYEAAVLAFKALEKVGVSKYAELSLMKAAEMSECEEINLEGE